MRAGALAEAEEALKAQLTAEPDDVAAILLLAELAARTKRGAAAGAMLERCLALEPQNLEARAQYYNWLSGAGRHEEALKQAMWLCEARPDNPDFQTCEAGSLSQLRRFAEARDIYVRLTASHPQRANFWVQLGNAAKKLGDTQTSVRAYRQAATLSPSLGEAWWGYANLKTVPFETGDIARMRAALHDAEPGERAQLHYALGKALEDNGDYGEAFSNYEAGARLRRTKIGADGGITDLVRRTKTSLTRDVMSAQAGRGSPSPGPIFIVGMPRSGSTLLEQILSSHSQIEACDEMSELSGAGRLLGPNAYPEALLKQSPSQLQHLGEAYLEAVRKWRQTDKPFFTDKQLGNFRLLGLVLLALPNAKIIDARRHPMATCFSSFKQYFGQGQAFTYDLQGLGRYYRNYVELMAHFDAIAPGRVHRVIHERLVNEPETETRRALDFLGLPFEEACLQFYRNPRVAGSASSEQVRQPISTRALDQWRNFSPWLAPLENALGSVIDAYPDIPADLLD